MNKLHAAVALSLHRLTLTPHEAEIVDLTEKAINDARTVAHELGSIKETSDEDFIERIMGQPRMVRGRADNIS